MRVSGRIVGRVHVDGKVFVTQDGSVEGELVATNADVAGGVTGEIETQERLLLKESARVDGNVKTARLVIEEGALLNGDCTMGQMANGRAAVFLADEPASSSDEKNARPIIP